MKATRSLLVIADDIGIGPDTTTGILQLGARGIVTGSVLIVNSPHAPEALRRWLVISTSRANGGISDRRPLNCSSLNPPGGDIR